MGFRYGLYTALSKDLSKPWVGAERTAILFALRLFPRVSLVVSVLSRVVSEGISWDPELETASATYPDIRRRIFRTVSQGGGRPD